MAKEVKNYYVAQDDWYHSPTMTADIVQETDNTYQKTGLLNADGIPLYRVKETVPFGFRGK